MQWLGLTADEGPSFQSQLAADHAAAADALWAGGYLYACDCTREAIDERARATRRAGLRRPLPRPRARARPGRRAAVPGARRARRWSTTSSAATWPSPNGAYEDFVVVKSNGFVLYPLANLVDDRSMAITHVIRGEDLLPTTPKQVMMWEALNACAGVELVDAARLRAPADARQRAAQEALQAPRPGGRRVLPRPGLPARGVRQLPRRCSAGARAATRRSSTARRLVAQFASPRT